MNGVARRQRLARTVVDATLRANRRPDGMYHSYNTLGIAGGRATVGHLDLMLEGQVSVLESGAVSDREALELVRAIRASGLYRADQHT